MKLSLHTLIFIGLGLGVLFGVALSYVDHDSGFYIHTQWVMDLIGKTIFVGALKMLVAPLIFASIVAGITSLGSTRELGILGAKTFSYYLATTTIAVIIGLVLVNIIQPGHWASAAKIREGRTVELEQIRTELQEADKNALIRFHQDSGDDTATQARMSELNETFEERFLQEISSREDSGLADSDETKARYEKIKERRQTPLSFIKGLFATMIQNPFQALSKGSSLGIIFFAMLLGIACMAVGEPAYHIVEFFKGLNRVIMKLTMWVMYIAPVAIMCLMASLVGKHGAEVFKTLSGYILTVLLGIFLHIIVLLIIVRVLGGMSPLRFLKGMQKALLIAFSTHSSAATLPVTMECVEDNLKVPREVPEFVLPIGATVNMDGTALYEGVAVIFLIQIFGGMPDTGISLGGLSMILIFVTAVLASVGAAAVPNAGLITMVLVASAVGLPAYYLVFIFSVDAFLDQFRTMTNVMGDSIGSVVIYNIEKDRIEARGPDA